MMHLLRALPCLTLLAVLLSATGCGHSGEVRGDRPPDGPPHRCYGIESAEACDADAECESSWIQPLGQAELVWECAPAG